MNVELRPLTIEAAGPLLELINTAGRHDGSAQVLSMDEVVEEFDEPHYEPPIDGRLAYLDGRLAGWCRVWHRPSGERLERAYVFGTVDPDCRRQGVGRALLTWGRDRAVEKLRSCPDDLPKFVRVDASDHLTDAHRLYTTLGFEPVRWFEDLLRPVAEPPGPRIPSGIELQAWPSDRAEEVRVVLNQAFADHWGSTDVGPEAWVHRLEGYGIRTDLSLIAVDAATDAIIGACLNSHYPNDEALIGRREGWIDQIGTLGSWRGRGVASAMIAASIASFARAGLTHAALSVDSANPTGAAGLYRALGFEPTRRSITHQIEVATSL